jgi:hypothetical protein
VCVCVLCVVCVYTPADELDVVGVARNLSFYLLRSEHVQVGLTFQKP